MLAVATALCALLVKPYLPENVGTRIGAESVDSILNIIAASMLAVTTFSLGIMLSAFSRAASVTPRSARLLLDDTTIQNVLATFLGAFLFSLVGIITLQTGVYGDSGRLVLFIVTIAVVVVIFFTFIRWIELLRNFGSLGDTIQRIETATTASLCSHLATPYLGANPLHNDPPANATAIPSCCTGYVQHLDLQQLSKYAEEQNVDLHLVALPGSFVHISSPLAWIIGANGDFEIPEDLTDAWSVDNSRTFEQDPRFGFNVLAEIAASALPPSVNDFGTAIDILGCGVRILSHWTVSEEPPEIIYPRLWVPPLNVNDFFDDFFRPIARGGASLVELQIRLQKSLLALARTNPRVFAGASAHHAKEACERAEQELLIEADKEIIRSLAQSVIKEN